MKTCLVTTAYLDNQHYKKKTEKFVNYYKSHFSDIFIIDNASIKEHKIEGATIYTQYPFLGRPSHLEYAYLWRALYSLKHFFEKGYDKVVYADNDLYLLSSEAFDVVKLITKGWSTFHCKRHSFNETGISIITKDCKEYLDFVADGQFWKHNGKCMETHLPVTNVIKHLVGDRWSEYNGVTCPPPAADFSAQTPLEWEV